MKNMNYQQNYQKNKLREGRHFGHKSNMRGGQKPQYQSRGNQSSFNINMEAIFFDDQENSTKYSGFIEHAEKWAKASKENTNNQIRNIYDEILQINKDDFNDIFKKLSLLKAKLVYAKSRKTIKDNFYYDMKKLIGHITQAQASNEEQQKKTKSNFQRFLDFMEVFVAYSAKD